MMHYGNMMVEYKLPIITVNPDGANHTGNMGDTIPPMGAVPYNWLYVLVKK